MCLLFKHVDVKNITTLIPPIPFLLFQNLNFTRILVASKSNFPLIRSSCLLIRIYILYLLMGS